MTTKHLRQDTKAFCFDVFGTCVDWRTSVTDELVATAKDALRGKGKGTSPTLAKASDMSREDWASITEEWRASYYKFTRSLATDPNATFKTVDQHHHDALVEILAKHDLSGLWAEAEVQYLALAWHRLRSWPDTNEGLAILGEHFQTATLSNGNVSLLKDMQDFSGMRFTHTFSGEMFGTYKPNPAVYHGAAEKLGLREEQVAMVAAHLPDLKAAKGCGLQTVFVEREKEETADLDKVRQEGFVDLWISIEEDGFLAVTAALGLS